ncbi:N-acetylmuramoyl-L-alanine amidase [Neobacillus sp. NPDC093127]|uniref:peptidoglycan recognition protein family protein n=1 Tax=Neobacillus sp. NPDC093127 TaxID=3364296 RepID=UPI0038195B17
MVLKMVQKLMTLNDCYKAGKTIAVKGLMVHSTACPGIFAADWFSRWNKPSLSPGKCVHGFLDANEFYQYLPWNWRGWHGGGSSNDTHIGIEWCEPKDLNDKDYFAKVWANGVELYAMLCKMFNLTEKNIISHKEGWGLGVASNHGDPDHWWKLHGKTMDMFRADVANALKVTTAKNGWKKENEKWYFYQDGTKKTGWVKDKECWYFLDMFGVMVTGWAKINSKWYYLNPNGDMRIGWLQDKGKWYYLKADGSMATGTIEDKGKLYYLQSDGSMAENTRINVTLNVDKSGALKP